MMASKCKLCRTNDLDGTGAHLITESLVRRTLSVEGSKGRNKEMMFSMALEDIGKPFVGREVSTADIQKVFGKDLSDEELVDNINNLVDTQLVCHSCEKSFSPIENEFKTKTLKKLEQQARGEEFIELNQDHYRSTLLVIMLNIWRLSASDEQKYKLEAKVEEAFRVILREINSTKYQEIADGIAWESDIIKSVKFTMMYFEGGDTLDTSGIVYVSNTNNPTFLIFGNLVFIVFFTYPAKFRIDRLLSDILSKNQITKYLNKVGNGLRVRFLSSTKKERLANKLARSRGKETDSMIDKVIDKMHQDLYGRSTPGALLLVVKKRIAERMSEGDKISQDLIGEIVIRALYKCGLYYGYKKEELDQKFEIIN